MDYTPFTPMDESNYPSHILFGMSGRDCSMCMVGGNILMKDRRLLTIDESAAKEAAARSAAELWARLKDRDDSEYEWSSPAPLFQ